MPTTLPTHHHHQTTIQNPEQSSPEHQEQQECGSFNQPPPPLSLLEPSSSNSPTAKQPLNPQYQSTYQSFADIVDPVQNSHLFIHVASGQKISRPWQAYISDLDDFFERIYRYYRKSGFICIAVEHFLELIEILLVILFTFFFLKCVDYDILFKKKLPPGYQDKTPLKITIMDCLISLYEVKLNSLEVTLLVFALGFWSTKFGIAAYSIISNYAIRSFFIEALQIRDPSLYSWQEVQVRLINAQSHCLLRESHLDELAIHNRLLRRTNYMIALINKRVLPIYFRLPFLGEYIYLTSGLEFNLNILLFRGIFSLFDKNWKLRDEIKSSAERFECARRFSNRCLAVGLINLFLLPMILIWQLLYAFYTYVEALKRDPTIFSLRTWSRYGRWFCRHFNELDHELDHRLNRAHRPALQYMNSFTAPLLEIFARFITFISGILLSVLIVLTIYDEDVITVEHVLTLITGLGAAIAISKAFMSDNEPIRWSFAELDTAVLQHIHYRPHNHPPHTIQARNAMANIFVYKSTTIIEELISPLFIPYILIRHLRSKSLEIIDFFRVYTLELTDIGDVCTFSQFNFHQNGLRIFNQQIQQQQQQTQKTQLSTTTPLDTSSTKNQKVTPTISVDDRHTTCNGKLELSLINFKLKNPKWQPHDLSQIQLIDHFTKQSRDDSIVRPNLILPTNELNQQSLSTSTIDYPTTSTFVVRKKEKSEESQRMTKTSQIGNSNSLGLEHNSDFGFGEQRRRLLQLRYVSSVFSETEDRYNQMALSSIYLHHILDSFQQSQQERRESETSETNYRNSINQNMNESIPLLSPDHNRRKDDDLDDP